MLGDIKGTPTIRLYKPKRKQGNSDAKKVVVDYNYERKATNMKHFLDEQMPSFIEHVNGDLEMFADKATRNGLPQVLLFTSKAKTSPLTKYLSTEFRRRLLLGEVYPTKKNQAIMAKYGVTPEQLPVLIVIPPSTDGEAIRYDGDSFKRHRLESFLSMHALKDKVFPAKKKEQAKATGDGHSEF